MYKNLFWPILFILLFAEMLSSQTNDEQFNSFFQNFKRAVSDNDIDEILKLTNFPFISSWGASENQLDKQSFSTNPTLPSFEILSKAKFNKTVNLSKNKNEKETIDFSYENDSYIISHGIWNDIERSGGYGSFYFGRINGEYKYIKCESGD